MANGVLLALTREQAKVLFATTESDALRSYVCDIANGADSGFRLDLCDRWRDLHRALSDQAADEGGGHSPLTQVVLGGRVLPSDDERPLVLVRPDMVPHVANGLAELIASGVGFVEENLSSSETQLLDLIERTAAFYRSAADTQRCVVFAVID